MSKKKALVVGSSLLFVTAAMAADSPKIENIDLGNSFDHKKMSLEVNDVYAPSDIFTPTELNCAYGGDFMSRKYRVLTKKEARKQLRQEKRDERNAKKTK